MEKYDNETKKIDKIKNDNKTKKINKNDNKYEDRLNFLYPKLQESLSGVSLYKIKNALIEIKGEVAIFKLFKGYIWTGKIEADNYHHTVLLLKIAENLNKTQMEGFINGLIIHADINETIDSVSQKLQQLIYITPINKIMAALRKMKYKGNMQTNKILLNLQLAQQFNTIDKKKPLINILEITQDTIRQEEEFARLYAEW